MLVDINMRTNSLRAWILAARPKTLSGAAVPVMLGCAYAYHLCGTDTFLDGGWIAALLCFLFAFVMQIDANFINDYYDCVKKRDNEERLGPLRACQQGWVTLKAMKIAIALTTLLACIIGLPLVLYGGYELIAVGVACIVFCFLYTICFAQLGLGDVLVLLFFGIIPTVCTTYVIVPHDYQQWSLMPWTLGIATGMVIDCLLLVNNYRDIDNDKATGKNTLVVMIGKKATEYLYMMLVPLALVLILIEFGFSNANMILCFIVYFFHIGTYVKMKKIGEGRALNSVLGMTARNILIYGLVISLLVILA